MWTVQIRNVEVLTDVEKGKEASITTQFYRKELLSEIVKRFEQQQLGGTYCLEHI